LRLARFGTLEATGLKVWQNVSGIFFWLLVYVFSFFT
jgi:hypothetical protein